MDTNNHGVRVYNQIGSLKDIVWDGNKTYKVQAKSKCSNKVI